MYSQQYATAPVLAVHVFTTVCHCPYPGCSCVHNSMPLPLSWLFMCSQQYATAPVLDVHVFTTVCHCLLSWATWIWSKNFHSVSLKSILKLLKFFHQNLACISLLSRAFHMPLLSQSPWFYHPNNIWWGTQIVKMLPVTKCSPVTCYFLPIGLHIVLNSPFLNILNLYCVLNTTYHISDPHKQA